MKRAIYAGSFDPFTEGHLYVYQKALEIFDDVTIMLAHNPKKTRFTNVESMGKMIQTATGCGDSLVIYKGLVANYCKEHGIHYCVRGLRGTNDYLYEEQIAKVNAELFPDLTTIYIRARDDVISSTLVRVFYEQGVNVDKYLPYGVNLTSTAFGLEDFHV